jgi:hypothetical protein
MTAPTYEAICELLEIPEALRKHVAPPAPKKGKLAVARGILPAPPKALLAMQYLLLGDPDPDVVAEAEKGILGYPEDRLLGLLDRKSHPKLLEFVVYRRMGDRRLMETIVLLHQVNDKTLCYLAEKGTGRIVEMVAQNQERLIITPQIYRFLQRNPNTGPAVLDRIKSFHRLYGIELPDLEVQRAEAEAKRKEEAEIERAAQAAQAAAQARGEPANEPAAAPQAGPSAPPPGPPPGWAGPPGPGGLPGDFIPGEVYIPTAPRAPYVPPPGLLNPLAALLADWGIPARPDFVAPPEGWAAPGAPGPTPEGPAAPLIDTSSLTVAGAEELGGSIGVGASDDVDISGMTSLAASEFSFEFTEEESDFGAEFTDTEHENDDSIKESIGKEIGRMTVGQKIKLAYKGNKAVRELLVRDSNKIVGVAVIKSGRITDQEVMSIATNRSINEDVIRALSAVREYLRKYPVKVALASNPKTPIPTAIGLLNSLHVKDLHRVATNRNVSAAVFSAATRLYKARKTSQK